MNRTRLIALVPALFLAACVSHKPLNLSTQFTPPRDLALDTHNTARVTDTRTCTVTLADIRDLRSDTHAMGINLIRPVYEADTSAWVRSAFHSLNRDPRIKIMDDPSATSGLVLNVELLKAYIQSVATDNSVAVVLRVRYTGGDAPAQEQIYRGTQTDMNWDAGDGETQVTFDAALEKILVSAHADIVARCGMTPLPVAH